jgi:predicted phage-related endonuclease
MSQESEPESAELAKELVIATAATNSQPLDVYVHQLADYVECQRSIDFWEKRLKRLKAQLAEAMGNAEVGTVNGEAVLFYPPQNRFQGKEFSKQYPDFYRLYSRDFTRKQFDPNWLKDERPDLYEQFQVRAMRVTFNA